MATKLKNKKENVLKNDILLGIDEEMKIVEKAVEDNMPVLLLGDTGTGKTSIVRELAKKHKATYTRLNLNGGTTADEFAGKYTLDGKGGMQWLDGVLVDAMKKGHWLLLDEVNTALPEVLFYLHSLLDDDRQIVLAEKDGEVVKPHKNFRLFATMNNGFDYAGTRELNKAFLSRFPVIVQIQYPDNATEEKILQSRQSNVDKNELALMVRVANDLRKAYKEKQISYICSTRDLLSWAYMQSNVKDIAKSAKYTILNRSVLGSDEYKAIEDIMRLHIGKLEAGEIASVEAMAQKLEQAKAEVSKAKDAISATLAVFDIELNLDSVNLATLTQEEMKKMVSDYALAKITTGKK